MNVAVMYHRKALPDLDEDGWDQLTNVNLKGYWLMHQAVAPIMQLNAAGASLIYLPVVASKHMLTKAWETMRLLKPESP